MELKKNRKLLELEKTLESRVKKWRSKVEIEKSKWKKEVEGGNRKVQMKKRRSKVDIEKSK